MTRLLILTGCIALPIPAFAISMEEAGIWQTRHSLVFLAIVSPSIGILWHLFLWHRKKFKLSCKALSHTTAASPAP
jgi:hypothetical protein